MARTEVKISVEPGMTKERELSALKSLIDQIHDAIPRSYITALLSYQLIGWATSQIKSDIMPDIWSEWNSAIAEWAKVETDKGLLQVRLMTAEQDLAASRLEIDRLESALSATRTRADRAEPVIDKVRALAVSAWLNDNLIVPIELRDILRDCGQAEVDE